MPDLSVIIPARAEAYLAHTVESIHNAIRGDTEILVVIDGQESGPVVPDLPGVRVIRHDKAIGQRQSVNEAARISTAKFILKTDGHSMLDEGFDVKLMRDCEPDWIVIPTMYNLHAHDLVCRKCKGRYYNRGSHRPCPACGATDYEYDVVFQPNWKRKTDWMFFRSPTAKERPLRVQYWGQGTRLCKKCGAAKDPDAGDANCGQCGSHDFHRGGREYEDEYRQFKAWSKRQGPLADVMTGQGACWFLYRDRFWELGGLDEGHGSWGQMGVEIACKAWLSGGRHVVNRNTWFAHLFRCGDGESFPYEIHGSDQERARRYSIDFWTSGIWPMQKRPLEWIAEKFAPVPTWSAESRKVRDIQQIRARTLRQTQCETASCMACERVRYDGEYNELTCLAYYDDDGETTKSTKPGFVCDAFCSRSDPQIEFWGDALYCPQWAKQFIGKRIGVEMVQKHLAEDTRTDLPARVDNQSPILSVLIPARNEENLGNTIEDLLTHLRLPFEILVGLDGPEQEPTIDMLNNPYVRVIRSGTHIGMRPTLNRLLKEAKGRFILKLDAHCAIAEGMDAEMVEAWEPGGAVVCSRYDLDTVAWERRDFSKTDCRRLTHVTEDGVGLRSMAWPEWAEAHKDEEISETMTCSGSCFLIERGLWQYWGGWDEGHGHFGQEGAELACKVWLSGGRLLENKRTWYAHWNRGKAPYAMGANVKPKSIDRSHDLWLGNKWRFQKYSFAWLLERFHPPGWEYEIESQTSQIRNGLPSPHHHNACKAVRVSVDALWEARRSISEPGKVHRLDLFWDAFGEFVDSVLAGKADYAGRYREYLVSHIRRGSVAIPTAAELRLVRDKMKKAAALVLDLRDHGLKSPLEFYEQDGRLILWKGYRRLVILQRLGTIQGARAIGRLLGDRRSAGILSPQNHLVRLQPAAAGDVQKIMESQYATHRGNATDKYWVHNYFRHYDRHFPEIRKRARKVLECGLAKGASLAVWRKYFPKATIYGFDCDADRFRKFAGDLANCRVCVGDETNEQDVQTLIHAGPFDVIIDDASHAPADQRRLFDWLWPSVRPFGWYVIEDIHRNFPCEGTDSTIHGPVPEPENRCLPAGFEREIYASREVREVHWYHNIVFVQRAP
jgi:glycosyltransferase involved in cell wall biosynthesis